MEGRRIGRYRITSKLAEGGMGAVYLATHELMGREVVIKVLLPEMSTQRDMVQRFFNEARATANLEHPGIVAIFDLDHADDGRAYIVMERLRGETLHARLRRSKRLPVEQAIDVARQLASALGAAHEQGITHRDLKPGNIFVIPDRETPGRERIKVLDFGVAKLAMHQSSLVTHQGTIFGTPPYMAPEQCVDAATVDHRADLYAVGCILYECLCGRPPFVGSAIEVLAAQLRDVPAPPRSRISEVPPWLDGLVMRLLEKTPERRVQSCGELLEALDAGMRSTRSWAGVPGENQSAQETAVGLHRGQGLASAPTMGSIAGGAAEIRTGQGGRRRRVWLGVSAAVLGMLALGMYLGLRDANQGAPVPPGSEHASRQGTNGTDAGGEVDGTQGGPVLQTAKSDFDDLMAQAEAAIEQRDWAVAAARAREALELPGDDQAAQQRAQQVIDRAAAESGFKLRYDSLLDAVAKKDYPKVKVELAAIDKKSAYHQEAQQAHDRARDAYSKEVLANAEALLEQRKCQHIRKLQADTSAVWPEAGERLGEIVDACRKGTARPPQPPARPDEEDDPVESDVRPDKSFDELLAEAQDAATNNLYGKARKLCSAALELRPGEPRAGLVCAIAACNLGNARLAKRYYAIVQQERQANIVQICRYKGIDVRESETAP
jgi:tRNA A-37 threonylcarbamoyl transferase component Bud32